MTANAYRPPDMDAPAPSANRDAGAGTAGETNRSTSRVHLVTRGDPPDIPDHLRESAASVLAVARELAGEHGRDTVLDLAGIHNEANCDPRLDPVLLERIVDFAVLEARAAQDAQHDGDINEPQDAQDWTRDVPPAEGADVASDRPMPHRNVLDLQKLARVAPPEFHWIIRHWLSWHPTLLAALGGMGKTLLALMIGVALASGRAFIGPACDPVRVLLWLCEDDEDEIHRRLAAVCSYFDVDMASLAGWLVIDARRGLENTLYTTDFGKPVWTPEIEELRQQVHDYRADVLVLDNIAQIFAANPNAPHDTTAFINGIVGLVLERPFCPVFVGHTARAMGSEYANSAAWENAVRMRWFLGDRLPGEKMHEDEEPDPNVRILARRKANYTGKDFVRFTFQNGVLVPEVPEQEAGIVHHLYEKRARSVVLDAMGKLAEMGRTMSDAKGGNYLPKLILQYRLADGLGMDELERAMRAAQTDGEIVRGEVGRYANRTPKIGLVVAEK